MGLSRFEKSGTQQHVIPSLLLPALCSPGSVAAASATVGAGGGSAAPQALCLLHPQHVRVPHRVFTATESSKKGKKETGKQ